MATRNTGSEQLIKATARRMFLVEGKLHATTADIAQEAGVPRTSVHYYYRSRDVLFKQVFDEAVTDLSQRINGVLESTLPFRNKIENFVDVVTEETLTHPYLETFVVTEIIQQKFSLRDQSSPSNFARLLEEVKVEMVAGSIKTMDPLQFVLNLFSLMVYPAIVAPLYTKLFQIDNDHYRNLLQDRKEVIMKLIFDDKG